MVLLTDPRFKAVVRVLFWLALIFALTMAWLPYPPGIPLDRLGDKVEHMLAFATLAGLGTLGFAWHLRWRVAERLSFLGAMVEIVQSIPALHRDCDITDWIADTIAIVVATALVSLVLPRLTRGRASADSGEAG